jgi:hypothetical protein
MNGHPWILLVTLNGILACGVESKKTVYQDAQAIDASLYRPQLKTAAWIQKEQLISSNRSFPTYRAVHIVSAGTGPKRKLRYEIRPATRKAETTFLITVNATEEAMVNGKKVPPRVIPPLQYGVAYSVAKDGAIFFRALPVEGSDPSLSQYRRNLERRRGRFHLNSLGEISDIEFLSAQGNAKAGGGKNELLQILVPSIVRFPKEAVGIGAVWESSVVLYRGSAVVKQVATMTLLSRQGKALRVGIKIKQVGEAQRIPLATSKRGFIDLIVLVWDVSGEVEIELEQPTPRRATLDVDLRAHSRGGSERLPTEYFSQSVGTVRWQTQ